MNEKITLKPDQFKSLIDLIRKNIDAFSVAENDCGKTSLVQHKINTGDSNPIKQAQRRLTLAKRVEVFAMIKQMVEDAIVQMSLVFPDSVGTKESWRSAILRRLSPIK